MLKIIGYTVLVLIGLYLPFWVFAATSIIKNARKIKRNREEVLAAWQELTNARCLF